MRVNRKLKKVGGSVMVPIPPEALEELGLTAGSEISISTEDGYLRLESTGPRPPRDIAEFMAEFMDDYDEALRNLAQR